MITVPSEIRALLNKDSTPKNFRVHFPNGESRDLINTDIVGESVKLTESFCSSESLKFGLCESPYIEFECVGVGNIKNAIIECSLEIFCSSDVIGSEYKEDLNDYVYTIPYGRYFVDECKRQANTNRRKVSAYTFTYSEQKKTQGKLFQKMQSIGTKYTSTNTFDAVRRAFSLLENKDLQLFEKTPIEVTHYHPDSTSVVMNSGAPYWEFEVEFVGITTLNTNEELCIFDYGTENNIDELLPVIESEVREVMTSLGKSQSQITTAITKIRTVVKKAKNNNLFVYDTYSKVNNINKYVSKEFWYDCNENMVNRKVNMDSRDIAQMYNAVLVPYSFNIVCAGVPEYKHIYRPNIECFSLDSELFSKILISESRKKSGNNIYKLPTSSITVENANQYITDSIELLGLFCRIDRYGKYDFFSPKKGLFPSNSLLPSHTLFPRNGDVNEIDLSTIPIESVWYDDYANYYSWLHADYLVSSDVSESVDIPITHIQGSVDEWENISVINNSEYITISIQLDPNYEYQILPSEGVSFDEMTVYYDGSPQHYWIGELHTYYNPLVLNPWISDSGQITGIYLPLYVERGVTNFTLTFRKLISSIPNDDYTGGVYDVSENVYIKNRLFPNGITTELNALAESLTWLQYTAMDVTMRGDPTIMVGDITKYNSDVSSPIFKRTLKGIQSLMDDITSI